MLIIYKHEENLRVSIKNVWVNSEFDILFTAKVFGKLTIQLEKHS